MTVDFDAERRRRAEQAGNPSAALLNQLDSTNPDEKATAERKLEMMGESLIAMDQIGMLNDDQQKLLIRYNELFG